MTTVTHFGVMPIAGGLFHHSRRTSLGGAKVKTVTLFVPRRRQSDDSYALWLDPNSRGLFHHSRRTSLGGAKVRRVTHFAPRRRQSDDSYACCSNTPAAPP